MYRVLTMHNVFGEYWYFFLRSISYHQMAKIQELLHLEMAVCFFLYCYPFVSSNPVFFQCQLGYGVGRQMMSRVRTCMWPAVSLVMWGQPTLNIQVTVKRSFEVVEQIGFPYTSLPVSMIVWGQAHLGAPSPRHYFQGPAQVILCLEVLFLRRSW